jgi:cell division septation protein DedD
VRSHLIGVVLNGMRPDVSPDFDHSKQYRYYSSYAGDGEDKKKREQAGDGGHKVLPELLWKAKLATIRQGLAMEPHSVLRLVLLLGAIGLLGAGILSHNGNLSFAGRSESQPAYRAPVKLEQSRVTVSSDASEDSASVSKNEAFAHEASERSFREEIPSALQPAASPEKEFGRYPFSVCLGSFPNQELSKKATLQYHKKGISPFIVEVRLNKGTWYRVYTGYFERREDGNEYIEARGVQGAKVIETPWANLIGIYSSPSELQERTKLLHDLDYFPYVVKDEDGKERLYLGAFNERDRAQGMLEELKSKGIESRIVKR